MENIETFNEVLDAADKLPLDAKEELVEILNHRLAEEGRRRIAADIQQSREEFSAGRCQATTVDDLMREIQS